MATPLPAGIRKGPGTHAETAEVGVAEIFSTVLTPSRLLLLTPLPLIGRTLVRLLALILYSLVITDNRKKRSSNCLAILATVRAKHERERKKNYNRRSNLY